MKTRKLLVIVQIVIAVGIAIRLFTGTYVHDEFGERHFFVKHRPIWKWRFHSPIGQSDLKLKNLNFLDQKEELLFDEFIRKRGLSR